MNSISMCQICKEPITNHICINCVSKTIKHVLQDGFKRYVSDFNKIISKIFSYRDFRFCLRCRVSDAPHICPACYMKEFVAWAKKASPELVRELKKKLTFRLSQSMESRKFIPVTDYEELGVTDGVCESCETYSDELILVDGMWLCRKCGDGE